jgi:hypothetical protein
VELARVFPPVTEGKKNEKYGGEVHTQFRSGDELVWLWDSNWLVVLRDGKAIYLHYLRADMATTAVSISEVEQQMDGLVTRELQDCQGNAPRLTYRRQYAGFERAGRRVIYVNAIADFSDSWRSQAVTICDGTVMWFGAVYDPTEHRFDWFQFNGPFNGRKKAGPR